MGSGSGEWGVGSGGGGNNPVMKIQTGGLAICLFFSSKALREFVSSSNFILTKCQLPGSQYRTAYFWLQIEKRTSLLIKQSAYSSL